MTKIESLQKIKVLIADFEKNKEYHLSNDFLENHCEELFIKPFLRALGWDLESRGLAPFLREVVTQDRVKKRAPDYGFRKSGSNNRLFFIEAKSPSVILKNNKDAAQQARWYGNAGKTPISILFNFAEFAVYDCTQKQNASSDAKFARIKYLTIDEYESNFDFIYDTFGRDAIYNGNFHEFINDKTQKKGNVALDKDFVASLDKWRLILAKNIAANNLKIGSEDLNHAVQLLLDRIIFLRFCEDREVEPMGQLQSAAKHKYSYKNLFDLFYTADQKYNSGLFHFQNGCITEKLKIEDEIIHKIIDDLYLPKSDYSFYIMPVEILGNAYEQFLGKVLRITAGHKVEIEKKLEVRKAGGVYYTPQYIVDYIVENTVGKLIEGKTPKEIEKIKIVDPSCGSGSFLLGAYNYILNYHQNYYYSKSKNSKELNPDGTLTTSEKRTILINNIFGVDLDENAVEVSKLSLLLKCMEGETASSIKQQLALYHTRVLPDLDKNIVNGNSLIGFDISENELELDKVSIAKLEKKIRAFDWRVSFPNVFKQGGFNAVIGNPPYVNIENLNTESKKYFFKNYQYCKGRTDIYVAFIEKSLKIISKDGLISFIIPYAFTNQNYGTLLRQKLLESYHVKEIVDTSNFFVFSSAIVKNIILTIQNNQKIENLKTSIVRFNSESDFVLNKPEKFQIEQNSFTKLEDSRFETKPVSKLISIKEKLWKKSLSLSDICLIAYGARLNHKTKKIGKDFYISDKKQKGFKPFLEGKNIERYHYSQYGWLNYSPNEHYNSMFPELFENEKIMFINIVKDRLRFAYDNKKYYNSHTVINCVRIDKLTKAKHISARKALENATIEECAKYNYFYLLAILNSNLINWYFRNFLSEELHFYPNDAKNLPIKKIDNEFSEKLIKLAEKVVEMYNEKENTRNFQKIKSFENQIDEIVYKLYNLTPKEIQLIEAVDESN
ncbi:MAG: N-6 DNA methylase [Bacteroidetes bacterium]|nr:N-6 DNA methylase [Bacteroidota bacterium]